MIQEKRSEPGIPYICPVAYIFQMVPGIAAVPLNHIWMTHNMIDFTIAVCLVKSAVQIINIIAADSPAQPFSGRIKSPGNSPWLIAAGHIIPVRETKIIFSI